MEKTDKARDQWASKLGLVLAMAGNAVGLGNFLRFPKEAAAAGGAPFMIPYLVAFLLLGLPLMFVEWGMGRYGGGKGQATMPGILTAIKQSKLFRWLGVFGIWIPLFIMAYYTFIESWTLGYSFFSLGNTFSGKDPVQIKTMFETYSAGSAGAYLFFVITLLVNGYVLYQGISKGIEKTAKVLMPMLFAFAIVLVVRVLFLGTPNPSIPDANIANGFGFLWNPDFSKLGNFDIWVSAAGQIFFTLSLGMGAIACYASYVEKDDDVVASGLTTALTNETTEVVLGGSIAIPLAVAFFGMAAVKQIAESSGFGLGFVTMPLLFNKIPLGNIFGAMWFLLLFFAGITSSIAMGQIVVAFFEEIVGWDHKKSVLVTMGTVFVLSNLAIFGKGALDEMDYWAGTVGISIMALIEIVIWVHFFGIDRSWKELMRGSKIKLWEGVKWITAIISPIYLMIILSGWLFQQGPKILRMEGVAPDQIVSRWVVRGVMVFMFLLIGWLAVKDYDPDKKSDTCGKGEVETI